MKVLHVTLSCSRRAGGLFESVRGLVGAQLAHGIDASVACVRDIYTEEDLNVWPNGAVHVFNASMPGKYGFSIGLLKFMRQSEADLIHVHGVWNFASAAARLAGGRTALVVSPRGMLDPWILQRRPFVKAVSKMLVEGPVLRRAHIHALNASERQAIRSVLPNSEIFIAPNAVSLPNDAQVSAKRRHSNHNPFIFCFLGRLHQKKGILELLAAVSLLRKLTDRSFTVRIYGWGDGDFEGKLRSRIAAEGLAGVAILEGAVQGTEKDRAFQEAHAFILPSFSEGLPMAVLEAASHGLPIVMTEQCNLPAFFSRGCAIKIDQTPQSISEAMLKVLDMPDPTAMGAAARNLVESEFSWEASLPLYLCGYAAALKGVSPMLKVSDAA